MFGVKQQREGVGMIGDRPSQGRISRRNFTMSTIAAGVAVSAGKAGAATPVTRRDVQVRTDDGVMDAVLIAPDGKRRSPGVIFYPDAFGLRPVMTDMGARLAGNGYAVIVINQFYRLRPAPVLAPGFSFDNPEDRAQLMGMIAALDHEKVMTDASALVDFLDTQPEVDNKARMGTVGFCMGGAMAIRTAAAKPARTGAVISFHGGRLVTEDTSSPHRLVGGTAAAYHIAIAADDDAKEPDAKGALRQAFDTADRLASIEVYPGTLHGWMVPDSDAYNPEQAERGWSVMTALFKRELV
ncbi:MAG: dienelactone hydrolase family protein [Sphingomonadaceae bacterium]